MNRIDEKKLLKIYSKMYFCRKFEERIAFEHREGNVLIPIYLSVGQESIPATFSEIFPTKTPIFAQHRSHSWFLSFGGSPEQLRDEILSNELNWSRGSGGSASISSREINFFGHSGFMGDQVPFATGYVLSTKKVAISVVGDASLEEDYVFSSFGYAITRKLPLLLICEDNNLSILTPKSDRRNWEMVEVFKSMGAQSFQIDDDPIEIWTKISDWDYKLGPMFLNIKTERHLWHAGSGKDNEPISDRLNKFRKNFLNQDVINIEKQNDNLIELLWK